MLCFYLHRYPGVRAAAPCNVGPLCSCFKHPKPNWSARGACTMAQTMQTGSKSSCGSTTEPRSCQQVSTTCFNRAESGTGTRGGLGRCFGSVLGQRGPIV